MAFLTDHLMRDFLGTCEGIRTGSLRVHTPTGTVHDFGAGEPVAEIRIHDRAAVTAIAARGDIGFGESYVAGLWDSPCIESLTRMALLNLDHFRHYAFAAFWQGLGIRLLDRVVRRNSRRGAARNIRAHYDVGNEFYQHWLDEGMTYSSGLFTESDRDLLAAQNRKYDRILGKLTDGDEVLELGCGWGGFAERAADAGRDVTGLTISRNQKGYADARLDGRAEIRLQDYRACEGTFSNIVSIEMVEAVGERYWPTFFQILKERLATGGRAVLQAITVQDSYFDIYRRGSDYIRHYTFPGGMLLSDAVISDQARRAGLAVQGSFAFGQHYAETCRHWANRLDRAADRLSQLGYGPAVQRHWRYYLRTCAASFATGQSDVVQVELTHA